MTPRYRCPWCGSFGSDHFGAIRSHILRRHRTALIQGLGLIETFGTSEEEIAS